MNELFRKLAVMASNVMGSAWAFLGAGLLIVGWLVLGPVFQYSETWQLVINTLTTIITFLMVFLIQNTQNRDIRTIQLKLDELLRAIEPARTQLVNLEQETDEKLETLSKEFQQLGERMGDAGGSMEETGKAIQTSAEKIEGQVEETEKESKEGAG